jgi:hypothetical protein
MSDKSKLEQCRVIYKRMIGKSRKDIRLAMESKVGISKACSNTYYYICRDEVNEEQKA